jgi:hypothetical protein
MEKTCVVPITGRGGSNVVSITKLAKELGLDLKKGDMLRARSTHRKGLSLEKVRVIVDKD